MAKQSIDTTNTESSSNPATTALEYFAVLKEVCPPKVWKQVIKKTVEAAKEGDAAARTWLANYLIGKPQDMPEIPEASPEEIAMEIQAFLLRARKATDPSFGG